MKLKYLKTRSERLINKVNELASLTELNEQKTKRLIKKVNGLEKLEIKIQEINDGTITKTDIDNIKSCIDSAKEKLS